MGHLAGKDIYRQLGEKIDSLQFRAPWNDTLREILTELYSPDDARLLCRMPLGLSTLDEVARVTGEDREELRRALDSLCDRGLAMDLLVGGEYRYAISPLVIGIFEFTMMRTDGGYDAGRMARLFHEYFETGAPFAANYGNGEQTTLFRALAHEETLRDGSYAEVLDYERAVGIVEQQEGDSFSLGICACRHEHLHIGDKECEDPLEMCTSFGVAAEWLIRRNMAQRISRGRMLEHLARSRERGLVFCADNIQRNVTFICNCCRCCCGLLDGVNRHGYTNIVATSGYIARSDDATCKGCNHCEKACPVDAIRMVADDDPNRKRKKKPLVDEALCLGCGVCAVKCQTGAMKLEPRARRVIPPETTFHRVLLMALERGNLQNMIFTHPELRSHRYLRGLLGGFLRLTPVKRALMSDTLRSRFLAAMERGIRAQRQGWVLEL
jgi:Na+-translocating ferredoxin:NAD+ oxidoreductase RNF subunit RnfB